MSFMIPEPDQQPFSIKEELLSFGDFLGWVLNESTQKVKDIVMVHGGQFMIGFGLGVCMCVIERSLTGKIVTNILGGPPLQDPLRGGSFIDKLVMLPFTCVYDPIVEEELFRGSLQETLKEKFESFYVNQGCSDSVANITARITSVFFTSIVFGLVHFSNALVFLCNPVEFLPQVVGTTIMGLMFGLAKELSGELYIPIGMHCGNNVLAYVTTILI